MVRPPGVVGRRFKSLYLFAACRPGTDETFALALPPVNAVAMTIFLEHLAHQFEPGARDPRAESGRVARRAGPACAGNHHLVADARVACAEPVGVGLGLSARALALSSVLNNYEAVLEAVCRARNRLLDETGCPTSLTAYPYRTT